VGTITEIYDFLRLFYARVADAYSYNTNKLMVKMSEDQIIDAIIKNYKDKTITILAPIVKGRKGHYRELFEQIRKQGYLKVRVDNEVLDLEPKMQVDRYKIHDIEIVVDRIVVNEKERSRVVNAVRTAMKQAKGIIKILDNDKNTDQHFSKFLMCPDTGISYDEPQPNSFSFNSPYGACEQCDGLGYVFEVDEKLLMPNKKLSIAAGGIVALGEYRESWNFQMLKGLGKAMGFTMQTPLEKLSKEALEAILYGTEEPIPVQMQYGGQTASYNVSFQGIVKYLDQQNDRKSDDEDHDIEEFVQKVACPTCNGARLKKESLQFKIDQKNIFELASMDLQMLSKWFDGLEKRLSERQNMIASEILKEIRARIGFLLDVGLEYLNLDRVSKSLSGGEAQRIRLATQIGSQLVNVLYILDEPSIGLHQRDNEKLISALKNLRDLGNSILVVEHDKDMIMEADHVIDVGPAAGVHGGQIVAQGTPSQILKSNTITAQYINGERAIEIPKSRRKGNGKSIKLEKATGNNLRNVDLEIPLGKFICVTGVSGSGKSTLINETLYPILNQYIYHSKRKPLAYKAVKGLENVDKVIEIDQTPIGRTPRSNPATYTGVFSDIRNLFVQLPEAKIRGYKPGRFSFNVKGGRCETCEGAGMKVIEMNFLPDVQVLCETCNGKRYNRETLEVRYKGKSIADVLNMSIEEAVPFFENMPQILRKIKTIQDVGLGYITIGQSSVTLSGGEAQRVKLATELSKKDTGKTIYILDEPTTGLHFEDIRILLGVLDELVNRGNTVLVIEHNMDVIKVADHVIDMGPEGGAGGGQIIFTGTPEELAKDKKSYTGKFLKKEM
jgi:excinuclease ABC subunit A